MTTPETYAAKKAARRAARAGDFPEARRLRRERDGRFGNTSRDVYNVLVQGTTGTPRTKPEAGAE